MVTVLGDTTARGETPTILITDEAAAAMLSVQPRGVWSYVTRWLVVRYHGPYGDRYPLDGDAVKRLAADGVVR